VAKIHIRVSWRSFLGEGIVSQRDAGPPEALGRLDGELAKQGHQPAGEAVHEGGRTIRGKNKVVTDGPYAS